MFAFCLLGVTRALCMLRCSHRGLLTRAVEAMCRRYEQRWVQRAALLSSRAKSVERSGGGGDSSGDVPVAGELAGLGGVAVWYEQECVTLDRVVM